MPRDYKKKAKKQIKWTVKNIIQTLIQDQRAYGIESNTGKRILYRIQDGELVRIDYSGNSDAETKITTEDLINELKCDAIVSYNVEIERYEKSRQCIPEETEIELLDFVNNIESNIDSMI